MKAITLSALSALPLAFLPSCTSTNTAAQQQPSAYPQGQTANPYGVPGQSDVGQYTPAAGTTPYQPVQPINPPALPAGPSTPSGLNNPLPTYPSPNTRPPVRVAPIAPTGGTGHTVVKGDSLWGLSRKYGVSADAIRQANGMAAGDSTIRTGTTLQIPRQ